MIAKKSYRKNGNSWYKELTFMGAYVEEIAITLALES